jgi:GT2 family glycosyltransferase
VSALAGDERAAIAGGTICYYPDTNKVWYAGGRFIPWRASSFAYNVGEDVSTIQETASQEVTFITGCMMLIKSEAILSAGMFDERFFMYSEDSELSLRYIKKGYRLLYVPQSVIYHKIQHHGDTPFTIYYGVRNRLLLIQLVLTGLRKILAYTYLYAVFLLKGIYWMFGRRLMAKAVMTGIVDFWVQNFSKGNGHIFQITRISKIL